MDTNTNLFIIICSTLICSIVLSIYVFFIKNNNNNIPSPSPSPPDPSPSNKCPYGSFKSCFEQTSSIEGIACNVAYDTCENRCDNPHESMYTLCHESKPVPDCPWGSFESCFESRGEVPCNEAYTNCKNICPGTYKPISQPCSRKESFNIIKRTEDDFVSRKTF